MADIAGRVTVDFATRALGMPMPETTDAARHWYDQVFERPAMDAQGPQNPIVEEPPVRIRGLRTCGSEERALPARF